MKTKTMVVSAVLFCLIVLMGSSASALIITDSSSFNVTLNDGAYITQSTAPSNWFNQELFTSGNETVSGTVAFSNIPYFSFADTLYFQLVYDMQETGGSPDLSIDAITLSVGGVGTFWTFDQASYGSILLNSQEPYSSTELGAGGDMELYVPVSLFTGYGLTGSDILTLTVTQSLSSDGTDEWVVLGSGSGGSYFASDEPITDGGAPVPEPGTMLLLGFGLVGLAGLSRRKSSHK